MLARGARRLWGKMGQQVDFAEAIELRDHCRAERSHRRHGDETLAPPLVHGSQQCVGPQSFVTRAPQQFGDPLPLPLGLRGFRRPACRGMDTLLIRDRSALAQDLHGEFPHGLHADRQTQQVAPAQPAGLPCFVPDPGDGRGNIDLAQVVVDCVPVEALPRDAAAGPQARSGRMGVCDGQRLVGKPRVSNEPSGSGRTHDVAAPERVYPKNGVGDELSRLVHSTGSLLYLQTSYLLHCSPFFLLSDPNQTYTQSPTNNTAETVCDTGSEE